MTVAELFRDLPCKLHAAPQGEATVREVTRVVTQPHGDLSGALFVCVRGILRDSADSMAVAYRNGCRLFLCTHDTVPGEDAIVWITKEPDRLLGELAARVCGHPARSMTVIGITGAVGGTRVTLLLEAMLRRVGLRVSTLCRAGLSLNGEYTAQAPISADAAVLQENLSRMCACGTEVAVLELSAAQLRHNAAVCVPFSAVLITDRVYEPCEARGFSGCDAYAAAQDRLLEGHPALAILPLGESAPGAARVLHMGERDELFAEEIETSFTPQRGFITRLCLHIATEQIRVELPTVGGLCVEVALAAAGLARLVGLSMQEIAQGLSQTRLAGYAEYLSLPYDRHVFLDAAYSPKSLEQVLLALRAVCRGRLSVLIGSVGGRARERRAPLAQSAERFADHVYLSADDPDSEDPAAICEEMRRAMSRPACATVLPDRREAIRRAVRELYCGDVLLIAGKGNAGHQLIGGVREPFCEREIVQMCQGLF